MDTGIGHEIEGDLQAHGYPILWLQYLPGEEDLMNWLFEADLQMGRIKSPFDISDVWTSSYSSNTNEIMWGAKVAARCPWITCVVRLSSYECGMDQPTYTPTQKIVEATGTLFFKFGDLDSTKPAGGIQDPHRDHRPLPVEIFTKDHAAEAGMVVAELSARPSSSVCTTGRDSGRVGRRAAIVGPGVRSV